jgi:hypothetical protein
VASPAPGGTGPPASPAPGGGDRPPVPAGPVPPGAGDATLTGPTLRANLPPLIYIGGERRSPIYIRGSSLPPFGGVGSLVELRRIFADAKILASDFCVRKNPSAYYALA